MRAEHAIGPLASRDDDADPAHDPVLAEEIRCAEPGLGGDILDEDGLGRQQGVTRRRIPPRPDSCPTHVPRLPSHAGAQQQCLPVGRELEDLTVRNLESAGNGGDSFVHLDGQIALLEGSQPELSDGLLLPEADL